MKAALLDTDVLSEFLRGHPKVIEKVDEHLKAHGRGYQYQYHYLLRNTQWPFVQRR